MPPNVAVTAAASPSTPNGLAVAAARLTSDARNSVRTTLVVVAALLESGEQVEAVSAGVLSGAPAVLALTDRRVMAVNQQDWAPIVTSFTVDQQLDVQAWEDAAAATVVLAAAGRSATLESITDRTPAYDLVQRIRTRTGR